MALTPIAITYNQVRYLSDGYQMRKQIGETYYPWGVPIPPAATTAVVSNAGNVEAGDYRVAVVAENLLGHKSNPWKTDANFIPLEVTVPSANSTITLTLPIHGDPQVERLLAYRTYKDEVSPYYFAGYVNNGTTSMALNGADASLATTDFLEGPISDADSLAGPFRYGRPPVKTLCEVAMDDIVFCAGEEEYTDGVASFADGTDIVTFKNGTKLHSGMIGKYIAVTDMTGDYVAESQLYTILAVKTETRLQLASNYQIPDWKVSNPTDVTFEIIGDANEVAPAAPGEPEHFIPTERFNVGQNEGGRIKGLKAYGQDLLVLTEDRVYRVEKGYNLGTYNTRPTRSAYGCIAPRSVVAWAGGCFHFDGTYVCNYHNNNSEPVSLPLGDFLRKAVQERKKDAISIVMGTRLYFAISLNDPDFLDTIFVYDLSSGAWDMWDTFKIVDMQTVTAPSGRKFLYLEAPIADTGYGLFSFSDTAYNDGMGGSDYSGSVVTSSGRTVAVDATLPYVGNGLKGFMLRIEWTDNSYEEKWIEDNLENTITVASDFTTQPNNTCTYTLGAMNQIQRSGRIGYPDALVEQDVKVAEFCMEVI